MFLKDISILRTLTHSLLYAYETSHFLYPAEPQIKIRMNGFYTHESTND